VNERQIIELLGTMTAAGTPDLQQGIGDDCAVIRKNRHQSWLVTMDTLVESVHFDRSWHPPDKLGRKVISVNVSDIAAMGGTPLFVFLSLGMPVGFDVRWLREFSRGLADACREYHCILAGGDTVRSSAGVLVTVAVMGEMQTSRVVLRSGAQIGDSVWVSGYPGRAAAGLELCRLGRTEDAAFVKLLEAHLNPRPRLELGRQLARNRLVHAMMDLSDGLATDLAHICTQSNVGAVIDPGRLREDRFLAAAAGMLQKDPGQWMLTGGEDYELVFTADKRKSAAIVDLGAKLRIPVVRIGRIDVKQGVRTLQFLPDRHHPLEVDISYSGYDHFPDHG
jgi:thiamine-monophosphate kinase